MRPSILNPLFCPLDSLPGLGKRLAPLYDRLTGGGGHLVDALWHFPTGIIDRRASPTIMQATNGSIATLDLIVDSHIPPARGSRAPWRIRCRDQSGYISITWFHPRKEWLEKSFPVGQRVVVSGKVDVFHDERQMAHPDHVVPPSQADSIRIVEPVYPLSAGIVNKTATKVARTALERTPELPEWINPHLISQKGWPHWKDALGTVHHPQTEDDLSAIGPARQRLAYDELLANQLALLLVRRANRKRTGRVLHGNGSLRRAVAAALPFSLTQAQQCALDEIFADMQAPDRMLRLLQGDVGSGKTVVGLMAMLNAVECGTQAALMAPTEILARQHLETLAPLAKACGIRVALLTGRDKGKPREALLQDLKDGAIDIIIGTHALFQDDVVFRDLGLAVIDEQHRFGVQQRLMLTGKGKAADVLVMTATPIPRTLTLTLYGDMDVSRLEGKPPGRKPVDTRIIGRNRLEEVIAGLERVLNTGAKAYWVCPLVEESETSDLSAAEERYAQLQEHFGHRVAMVHGRMKGPDKDAVMEGFASDRHDILVATTVIEVGVNVPTATLMIIEQAERFGLAQLHQLRGRIGRGDRASVCLLLYGHPLSETARMRLETMRSTEDGFVIAEEDLRLRGGGEILGLRQSGMPEFRTADLAVHGELLATARDDARHVMEMDPELATPRGEALRILLYLFERDAAVRTLQSG
ncbi:MULTISPECIES: ATP-dependent DNA helicase RecG [unclassified Haematospirillum]|uniref:ATP-dependent DNA helicase RecG n=1 Tax=unclassified Haematospirillum TaxID=2622088 RepID=UPI00143B7194|nr:MULTISPECIES: ATP-dependent DNA helicase RecG [unclassified Haematospirillum]NKD54327.1 ATP-dependent DNA helicase RecG [Haematospirillum sp. H4890]NKD74371.1 ATP-dependent DNA helicase RecG [Haematospirillum sp. H4485]